MWYNIDMKKMLNAKRFNGNSFTFTGNNFIVS